MDGPNRIYTAAVRRRPPESWFRGSYVFVVTALAVFVAAICLLRDSTASYVATATLVPVAPQSLATEADVTLLMATLNSTTTMRDAAAEHRKGDLQDFETADLHNGLTVERVRGPSGRDGVKVSLMGPDLERTVAVVNALARRAIESTNNWRLEPAIGARRIPRSTSVPVVLLSAAVAVVFGSGTLLAGGATRTIDRASDATETLKAPVLGSLADQGKPTGRRRHGLAGLLRAVLLLSELAIAAVLLIALVTALVDRDFAAQLTADPLSALADGLRRLPDAVGGLSL